MTAIKPGRSINQ